MSRLTAPMPSLRQVDPLGGVRGGVRDLGGYLREQREHAQLSVRQLSRATGISNPYLSQIERGLRRPSAEILQALAKGLEISAESLYIRAGLLDPDEQVGGVDARSALRLDRRLTARQQATLIDLYDSFVADGPEPARVEATPDRIDRATPGRP